MGAHRPLPAVAAKTKNFPSLFLIFGGGCGGSRQKMERKFLVLLRRFRLLKEQSYFNILFALFSVLAARRGASSPSLVVTLNYVASLTCRGKSRKWSLATQSYLRNDEA
jgi:hypothetical protein